MKGRAVLRVGAGLDGGVGARPALFGAASASSEPPRPGALTPVPSPAPSQPPSPGEGNPVGAVLLFSLFSRCGGWEGAGEEGRGDEGLTLLPLGATP